MPLPEATTAISSSSREIRCSTTFGAIRASKLWCKRLLAGNNAFRIGRWAFSSVRLRLVVNRLAAELLPVRVCSVHCNGARFTIRRDADFSRPGDLAIFHRSDGVRPIIYNFV